MNMQEMINQVAFDDFSDVLSDEALDRAANEMAATASAPGVCMSGGVGCV
jgi:hypothetical protein